MTQLRRRALLPLLVTLALPLLGVGCSSGSDSSNALRSPNNTSRQNVLKQLGRQQVAMSQNGTQSGGANATIQGGFAALLFLPSGGGGNAAGGGGGFPAPPPKGFGNGVVNGGVLGRSASLSVPHLPSIGAFVMNVATRHAGRPTLAAKRAVRTREEVSFYYDEYLLLWVSIDNTANSYSYTLYEDQEKTKPAGGFTSTYPTDPNVFPQVYKSEYSITAGTLKGSSGNYTTTINADYSGSSSYSNNLAGIYSDNGSSTWNVNGSSTWTAHSVAKDGAVSDYSGQFNSDGSGHTLSSDSLGHSSEYFYNADGTGHGTIKGPEDGLPATVVWDNMGVLTITWADGTKEVITPNYGTTNSGGGGTGGSTDAPPPASGGSSGGSTGG